MVKYAPFMYAASSGSMMYGGMSSIAAIALPISLSGGNMSPAALVIIVSMDMLRSAMPRKVISSTRRFLVRSPPMLAACQSVIRYVASPSMSMLTASMASSLRGSSPWVFSKTPCTRSRSKCWSCSACASSCEARMPSWSAGMSSMR